MHNVLDWHLELFRFFSERGVVPILVCHYVGNESGSIRVADADAPHDDPEVLVHLDPHAVVGVEVEDGLDVRVTVVGDLAVQIDDEVHGELSVVHVVYLKADYKD